MAPRPAAGIRCHLLTPHRGTTRSRTVPSNLRPYASPMRRGRQARISRGVIHGKETKRAVKARKPTCRSERPSDYGATRSNRNGPTRTTNSVDEIDMFVNALLQATTSPGSRFKTAGKRHPSSRAVDDAVVRGKMRRTIHEAEARAKAKQARPHAESTSSLPGLSPIAPPRGSDDIICYLLVAVRFFKKMAVGVLSEISLPQLLARGGDAFFSFFCGPRAACWNYHSF